MMLLLVCIVLQICLTYQVLILSATLINLVDCICVQCFNHICVSTNLWLKQSEAFMTELVSLNAAQERSLTLLFNVFIHY